VLTLASYIVSKWVWLADYALQYLDVGIKIAYGWGTGIGLGKLCQHNFGHAA